MNANETQLLLENADLLFDEATCQEALQKMTDEITAVLSDKNPLLLPVMGGAVVFTGQLLPKLQFPLDFDYVHVSRYDNKTYGGDEFKWIRAPQNSVKDRDVLILDDILDEGHTMFALHEMVMSLGARSCRSAVFANKLLDKTKPIAADFIGLDVPNRYVFGFGMDVHGKWRNLPCIYALPIETKG